MLYDIVLYYIILSYIAVKLVTTSVKHPTDTQTSSNLTEKHFCVSCFVTTAGDTTHTFLCFK